MPLGGFRQTRGVGRGPKSTGRWSDKFLRHANNISFGDFGIRVPTFAISFRNFNASTYCLFPRSIKNSSEFDAYSDAIATKTWRVAQSQNQGQIQIRAFHNMQLPTYATHIHERQAKAK